MNVKRFTARTSRDALHSVRQAFGDDAVVLSDQAVRATASRCWRWRPKRMRQIEQRGRRRRRRGRAAVAPADAARAARRGEAAPATTPVEQDVPTPVDEHAVVPGLRARAHAAPPPAPRCSPTRPRPSCRRTRSVRRPRQRRTTAGAIAARRLPQATPQPLPRDSATPPRCGDAVAADARVPAAREPLRLPERRAVAGRRRARAARAARGDDRAALDEGPDRRPLQRARLHGEAAAPARARRA